MELCSTTQSILNHPKIPCHFRPKISLTLKKTIVSSTSHRLLHSRLRIRAAISEDPNQYVEEDRVGAVAVKDGPPLEKNVYNTETEQETEEAQANDFLDNFNIKFDSEDTYYILFYASGSLLALWLAAAVVGAIDSIPLFPKLMELVGLGYTTWFTARYLLFKETRDELAAKVAELKQQVLGSDDD